MSAAERMAAASYQARTYRRREHAATMRGDHLLASEYARSARWYEDEADRWVREVCNG